MTNTARRSIPLSRSQKQSFCFANKQVKKGAEILIPHLSFLATRKSRKAAKKIGEGCGEAAKKEKKSLFRWE